MAAKRLPSAIYLRALFRYDPATGRLDWRHRYDAPARWNAHFAGRRAGGTRQGRRRTVFIQGVGQCFVARVIWKMVHGREPAVVDHINGDPADDRIVNLRAATKLQNAHNRRGHSASGFKGVSYCRAGKTWQARICVKGRLVGLGRFADPADAHAAYLRAARRHFGAFARGDWAPRRRR